MANWRPGATAVAAALVLGTGALPWLDIAVADPVTGADAGLTAPGVTVEPVLLAAGLVLAATTFALLLSGPRLARALGVAVTLAGALVIWASIQVHLSPQEAAAPIVADAVGAGAGFVPRLTGWALAGGLAGGLVAALGLAMLVRPAAVRRRPADHAVDDWTRLSNGEDPTVG